MPFPSPDQMHPVRLADGGPYLGTVFLAAAVDHPRMVVGDYTYASAFDPPTDWAARLAPYLFDFSPEQLIVGKFCQIADGVVFITASANHRHDGISTCPFAVFDDAPNEGRASLPLPGRNTTIGNDVWIGRGARILPGATIGNGVIVGAGAVVSGDVPAYAVVVGNPARVVRARFTPKEAARLDRIAWWHWPIEKICAHEAEIMSGDITALANSATDA